MELKKTDLINALGLGKNENVAIVGGGGKTSLMLRLAQKFISTGCTVITTTTTKVWLHEAQNAPFVCLIDENRVWDILLRDVLNRVSWAFLGRVTLADGKVGGVDPDLIDKIYEKMISDYMVVEADGAAGRPLKVPIENEPVVASTTTSAIAIVGADAVGKPFNSQWVFREKEFQMLTRLEKGETMAQDKLAPIFLSSQGLFKNVPRSAKAVLFFNRMDRVSDPEQVYQLADYVLKQGVDLIHRVVLGSLEKDIYEVWQ